MSIFQRWLKAIRAPFFTASIVPVILGSVLAWYETGGFNWFYGWLTMFGVILCHTGTNLANDYFDHTSGNDEVNKTPTPFSGGSRIIQQQLLPPRQILLGSLIAFGLCSFIGLYLWLMIGGVMILVLGLIGVLLGFFYTADPIRIGYRGFGLSEAAVGFGVGPLVVLGAYYVQSQRLDWLPLWASVPIGILIALVLYINEFPDYEADKAVSKKTLIVVLGKKKAMYLYDVLLTITYLWVIGGVLLKIFPGLTLLIVLTLPITIKAVRTLHKNYEGVYNLIPANAATILLHLSFGIIFSAGFFLERVIYV